jgi:hypothetical protein
MDFLYEFFNIDKEERTTYHDFHGFKWQTINIYPSLIVFLYGLTPFLAHWFDYQAQVKIVVICLLTMELD